MPSLTKSQQGQLAQLKEELPLIIEQADHDELYGHQLREAGEFFNPKITEILLIKLLVAYDWNYDTSKTKLLNILKWRKEFDPLSAAFVETHYPKFDSIGLITVDNEGKPRQKVSTWNLYGKVKDAKMIFGNHDKFLRWRVGLMEQALQLLDIEDPNNDYMVQIHDYKGVNMFKLDTDVKKGTRSIIQIFGDYYPELLSHKFFVNVPSLLSWVYAAIQVFVPEKTRSKFMMLNNGKDLGKYVNRSGLGIEYGGDIKGGLESLRFVFGKEKKAKINGYTAYILEHKFSDEVD